MDAQNHNIFSIPTVLATPLARVWSPEDKNCGGCFLWFNLKFQFRLKLKLSHMLLEIKHRTRKQYLHIPYHTYRIYRVYNHWFCLSNYSRRAPHHVSPNFAPHLAHQTRHAPRGHQHQEHQLHRTADLGERCGKDVTGPGPTLKRLQRKARPHWNCWGSRFRNSWDIPRSFWGGLRMNMITRVLTKTLTIHGVIWKSRFLSKATKMMMVVVGLVVQVSQKCQWENRKLIIKRKIETFKQTVTNVTLIGSAIACSSNDPGHFPIQ